MSARIEPGFPVHADKYAAQADYIIPINRVKVHTAFDGEIESGVCKMLSIGIGKHNGCSRIHQVGFPNFPIYIPKVSDVILNTFCIPFGVALVENAHEHLHTIRLLPRETLVEEEKELLKLSKSLMPKLNFEAVDILIVEQDWPRTSPVTAWIRILPADWPDSRPARTIPDRRSNGSS